MSVKNLGELADLLDRYVSGAVSIELASEEDSYIRIEVSTKRQLERVEAIIRLLIRDDLAFDIYPDQQLICVRYV